MIVPWYIPFTKAIFTNICITYNFFKIQDKKVNNIHKLGILIFNICMSLIYCIIKRNIEKPLIYLVYYSIFSICFLQIVKKNKFNIVVISITMSILETLIATIISFLIINPISDNLKDENLIEYLIVGIIQNLLAVILFRIKRFKNGFMFLNDKEKRKMFNLSGFILSFLILGIYVTYCTNTNIIIESMIFIIFLIGGTTMLYWIKKSITKYYKEKMKDRTVEIQQEQIKEKDKKIDDLQTELSKVLEINHKYNHRLSAMERAVIKLGNEMQVNTEFAEEYGDILDSLSELSKEYKAEVESINKTNKLPKTNIFSIDNLLDYMRQEAEKSKIEFKLQIEFDIKEIIENKIPKNKLETLLTDHIRDAIIAIENSENENKKIEVKFSNKEFYQVEFYDTGIEFEIETLLNLGLERTTTHKATGGTGIGFMTTFETLKECKASLEIEEFNNKEYTKAVIIGFDGKNEYRIHSYRAEEIKNKIQDNRIIID